MPVDLAGDPVGWYASNRSLYEAFTNEIYEIIRKLLADAGMNPQTIQRRTKDLESFRDKLPRVDYDPKQMQDLSAIRIILYVKGDIEQVVEILRSAFDIDETRSIDKARELGIDRVGYRSVHIVASLLDERLKLSENRKFSGLFFEVQVTTVLAHAWAEIEHDRSYKFSGKLPGELQRRFRLLAGALEMMDNEAWSIASEVDKYSKDVTTKTKMGKLDEVEINSTSLMQYMKEKFGDVPSVVQSFGPKGSDLSLELIEELNSMNMKTLADLDKIIPSNLKEEIQRTQHDLNFLGLIRDILTIFDARKFYEKAWKSSHYHMLSREGARFLKIFGVNLELISRYVKIYDKAPKGVRYLTDEEIKQLTKK